MTVKKQTTVKKKASTRKKAVSKISATAEKVTKRTKKENVTDMRSFKAEGDNGARTKKDSDQSFVKRPNGKDVRMTGQSREDMIQTVAYFNAEKRGFTNGDPVQDWLMAEALVDKMLSEDAA